MAGDMRRIITSDSGEILLNPGMGYMLIQRGHNKKRFDELTPDEWFLTPPLCDKIIFDVPWSVIEPEEGKFDWENPDWEGAMQSWIDAGYKVGIQVRGMGCRGTLLNDGAPQWLFDRGAKFIDESAGAPGAPPTRYPVYWDKLYLEKSRELTFALGERYNGNPAVEMVFPGFLGHYGEMHISEHTPIRPWVEAGFSLATYTAALHWQTESFKAAFPDKPLYQELGNLSYNTPDPDCETGPISIVQARELVPYLVSQGINLKYNGLGANWDRWGEDPFMEGWYVDYCRAYHERVKIIVENISTFHAPCELETLRRCHASYTNRGGERQGVPETAIDTIHDDCFRAMENYDPLSKQLYLDQTRNAPEIRRGTLREAAKIVGYRLLPAELHYPERIVRKKAALLTSFWENRGAARPGEEFGILFALLDGTGNCVWEQLTPPILPTTTALWEGGCRVGERTELFVPETVQCGTYRLAIGLRRLSDHLPIRLPLPGGDAMGRYALGPVEIL